MPNPVPLATKEEEDRRAWVTTHHEVVRLIKDCFGDRFSNNEIFDRLKISRRTGYRALGNDDRIGKAPGRKPKIMDNTIKEMIEYIEQGGCKDVGNVWKHLAERFAPDCNPKTVQDSVKKSGFTNYHNQVRLEPLLNEQVPENQPAPAEEEAAAVAEELRRDHARQVDAERQEEQARRQNEQEQASQDVIDPAFQQQNTHEDLKNVLYSAPHDHVRWVLHELVSRVPEAAQAVQMYLLPHVAPANAHAAPAVAQMTAPPQVAPGSPLRQIQSQGPTGSPAISSSQKRRLAVCRRCDQQYDRAENTMEMRECLYHKGSPQKINPATTGTLEQVPEAYIWSCCGGNGMVRGCCRAMHTTKKKRKYSKKRDADEAGLDDDDEHEHEHEHDEAIMMDSAAAAQIEAEANAAHLVAAPDPNIDSRLEDLRPEQVGAQFAQMAAQMAAQGAGAAPQASMQIPMPGHVQANPGSGVEDMKVEVTAGMAPDVGAQLRIVQASAARDG